LVALLLMMYAKREGDEEERDAEGGKRGNGEMEYE
jgi:hypothetical protein